METKNNKLPIIISICLAVVVAVLLSVLLFRSCGDQNNESSTDVSVNTEVSETVSDTEVSEEVSEEVSDEVSESEESIPEDHTHEYADAWSSNETDHWHECKCGDKADIANHAFGDWTTTKEATEDATGSKKRTCSTCGYEETATIPMLSHTHDYAKDWSSNETDHWKECKCGDKSGVTSHTYGDWTVTKEATEETEGSKYHTCSACSYKETVVIPVLSHSHKYGDWKNNATSHWKECECGDKSEMSAHTYGDWVIIKDATCTETGTKKHTCTACGYSETATIPVIAHTYGDWKSNATSHWKECKCGDKSELSSHTYGQWETVTEATCTAAGTKKHTCTACGYSENATISATGHNYGDWKKDGNNHWKECSKCGNVVEKAAHTYTSTVTPPTETGKGYTTHTCNKCGYSYVDSYVDPVSPYSQGLKYRVNRDGVTCTITGIGTCKDTGIYIPPVIDGYKVTAIGDNAFENCTSVTSITITDSVTSIGKNAFSGCTRLKYNVFENVYYLGNSNNPYIALIKPKSTSISSCVVHPDTKVISDNAFEQYNKLKDIVIQEGVTHIGVSAFSGCYLLSNITIPDSVTFVGDGAFSGCTSLIYTTNYGAYYLGNGNNKCVVLIKAVYNSISSCIVPSDTKVIYSSAFYYCSYLEDIDIPDGVTHIGASAFHNCTSLKSVTIGNSVKTVGASAFQSCTSLTSVTIPDGVTSIGACAFSGCTSLTSVTIPDSATSVGDYAFSGCRNLTSITIPDGVTTIGYSTFSDCTGLTSVTIPDSVTSVGDYAFENCTNLKSVTIGDSVTSISGTAFNGCAHLQYNVYDNAYYLGNSNNPYVVLIAAQSKSITNCTIHPDAKYIYRSAFQSCTSLTSIAIPDSVTFVGDYAFYWCKKLTSVTIGNGVTRLGKYAFEKCTSLASVTFGSNLVQVDGYIFNECENLTSVTISKCETSFNFIGLPVRNIYFQGEVEDWLSVSISDARYDLYFNNVLVTDVTIPDGATKIVHHAFSGCMSLTSVTIPDSVKTIGYSAFEKCINLNSVTIGNGVTSVGEYAFKSCASLTSITIPDSVTEIGKYAFEYCSSLKSITIGDGVTYIGINAFSYCYDLTNVFFTDTSGRYVTQTKGASAGINVDVSDSKKAVQYLIQYSGYYWYKQ